MTIFKTFSYAFFLTIGASVTAQAQWSNPDSQGKIYYNGGNVGIDILNPLGSLHAAGAGSDSWVYFSGNINGTGNPQNSQGLAFGWNRSGGEGESSIVYNKSLGNAPRLDFSSYDGTSYNIELTIKDGMLGIGTTTPMARFHSHEPAILGSPSGSFVLLSTTSGRASNFFAHNQWLRREEASSSQWWTARLHDGISIDVSYQTPGQNTRTWWERDPHDNVQSWGDLDQTFMTLKNGALGLGTEDPDALLTVKGDIHAREVKVDLSGSVAPDYVFNKDYSLLSLKELENYINQNKHLPEVPSAQDMETDGVKLKELNLLLLKKIEEITLHLINQNNRINILEEENRDLKALIGQKNR